jgi:ketosteroid isomerase-like protein
MDRAQIEAIIDRTYAAREAGDVEALVGMFGPGGVYRVAGATESFPMGADAKGEAAIRERVQGFVRTFQFMQIQPLDLIVEGDKAARRWRARIRHIASGEVYEMEAGDIWTFKDGKVASLIQFVDTAQVAEILRRVEPGLFKAQPSRAAPGATRPH